MIADIMKVEPTRFVEPGTPSDARPAAVTERVLLRTVVSGLA
jgi:hypothetical protein